MTKNDRIKGVTLFYHFGWYVCRLISGGYFGWDIRNIQNVPATGSCILAANHTCFWDPFFIGAALPREVYHLARHSAFRFPLTPIIRGLNAVPMDREGGGLKGMLKIIDILQKGNAITLYPEGTRTPDGNIHDAKSGIGLIVIKSGSPVVPVRFFGAFEAWNRHMLLPRPRKKVTIQFGKLLDFAPLRAEVQTCSKERTKEIYREVAKQIMDSIRAIKKDD